MVLKSLFTMNNHTFNLTSRDMVEPNNKMPNVPLVTTTIIIAILTAIFNSLLILAILLNPELRKKSKYFLILILSICDLLCGIVGLPICVYIQSSPTWDDGYTTLWNVTLIGFLFVTSFGILQVCAICLDWLTKVTLSHSTEMKQYKLAVFMTSIFCVGTIIMIQITVTLDYMAQYLCVVLMLSFPIIFNLTSLLAIAYFFRINRSTIFEVPYDIIIASITTVACEMPATFCFLRLRYDMNEYWVIGCLEDVRRVILPLVWLINRSSRTEMRSFTDIIRHKNTPTCRPSHN